LHVGQAIYKKKQIELEEIKLKNLNENFKNVAFTLADIRAIVLDSNYFIRVNAYKDTNKTRVDHLKIDKLPSQIERIRIEDEEATKGMTEEEKTIYLFNKGRTIKA